MAFSDSLQCVFIQFIVMCVQTTNEQTNQMFLSSKETVGEVE